MPGAGSPQQVGDYEILAELGRGGLSTVYLAAPTGTRRRVALKHVELLRPDEAKAAAFLTDMEAATPAHPAVLRPLTTFVHAGEPWLVLRLMAGGSLRRHPGPLSPAQTARVLIPVLDALDAAGRRGLAHGDLKPENVLLGPRGGVLVADFGLVAAHERARRSAVWGTHVLTPAYMAPEQATGAHPTPAADLFAVGVMAHELLTGRLPLDETGAVDEVVRRRLDERAPSLADAAVDLDARLVAWVDELTARSPEDRPPGAAAARARLEEILAGTAWKEAALPAPSAPGDGGRDGSPATAGRLLAEVPRPALGAAGDAAPPAATSPGTRRRPRRVPLLAWLLVGLAIVAGGVAGLVAWERSRDDGTPPARSAAASRAAPLAAAEYRRRGNAVCAGQPALADLFGAVRNPGEIRSVVLLALNSSVRPALAGLAALRPPPALQAAHRSALGTSRREADLLQRLADDIAGGAEPARATRAALPRLDRLEARADREFAALGLNRCARPGAAPGAGA